jgi:putative Mn2+ efflux pump MntP
MHGCASKSNIRLTKGLAESAIIALEGAALLIIGMWIGNLLRFTPESLGESATRDLLTDSDNLVCLALMIFVALRLMFRTGSKKHKAPNYDISRFGTAVLLGIAVGINSLLVGLGLGFRIDAGDNIWRAAIPLFVTTTIFALLGVMLGRQQKELRSRRYALIAALFILAFALKGAIWG